MERPSKCRLPQLSLIVPDSSKNPPDTQLSSQTSRSNGIAPAKQKRLFPVACRLVPMDQWFTTRVDRTWNVLDLKIWLLSKALPAPSLPLPASYRPSSPVTFAAAPAPQQRPSTATSYHSPTLPTEIASTATLVPSQALVSPISPITFAAPNSSSRPSTSSLHDSPQTPGVQIFYPPLSSAVAPSPSTSSVPTGPSSASSIRLSFHEDDEEVPLYGNSYGAMLDPDFEDEDEEEDDNHVSGIASRSIPYSYNTGAPAISGVAALKANSNKGVSGRGYSGSFSGVDMDLVQQATAIAMRWNVYSFSTGMLLSDDLPLAEYNIRPYELLEVHRAGAYISLPQTVLSGLEPCFSSPNRDPSNFLPPSTKTTRAYPSITTRNFYNHTSTPSRQLSPIRTQGDARDLVSSESSDDEYDDTAAGSPYAQPYFDGWVCVLRDGASRTHGSSESGNIEVGDGDMLQRRKMRRRGRAKSETAKSAKGKDRPRAEREWKDLKQPVPTEDDTEVQLQESGDRWNKRWLIIREGIMTLWKDRKDSFPEERYRIAACVGLYGADRLQSVLSATSQGRTTFPTPLPANVNASHSSASTSKTASTSSTLSHRIICARFRERSSPKGAQCGKTDGKSSGKSQKRIGTLVVLKVADKPTHEHLLRIFHRLSYSSPVTSSKHHSTLTSSVAPSRPQYTRTLRTDFLPHPIPQPISLSFSAPSPIQQGDESPISPLYHVARSDGSEYDDDWIDAGSAWGRSRRNVIGKGVARYVGLGRGVGVRYPEWREDIIQKAMHAGRGLPVPESRGGLELSPSTETSQSDQLDTYGFVGDDLDSYASTFTHHDYDTDDSDSDTFSEIEWESWAYDLDRPKAVDDIETERKPRDGLTTPQASPVSDPELAATPGPASDGASSPSTRTLRPRARSFSTNSSVQATMSTISLSSATTSPTISGGRVRSSTMSAHPRNPSSIIVEPASVELSPLATTHSSQTDHRLRPDFTTTSRTEPTSVGGVRSLMRGLSMRAGKESFLRGLENALDFVEGK